VILDQYGRSAQRPIFQPDIIAAISRGMVEVLRNERDFALEVQGLVVDHRGDPVYSKLPKIGETIQVKIPVRFSDL
jgi:hypothetical protein